MDKFSKETRSKIMSRIRSKNTSWEIIVRKALWQKGIRGYRLHAKVLGSPDIAFINKKIAIFIDGDFWHGWELKKGRILPEFWENKIKRNMRRDIRYRKKLREEGWKVIRVWEHKLIKNTEKAVQKLIKSIS